MDFRFEIYKTALHSRGEFDVPSFREYIDINIDREYVLSLGAYFENTFLLL